MTNYKDDDIAIIGMSGRFPEAEDLDQFWANLLQEKDLVKEFPKSRIGELKVMKGDLEERDYIREGYLDQVMQFEPEIFALPVEESRYIAPQQRLVLELVEEAILDAGYNPEGLSGREVGVFLTENDQDFVRLFAADQMMAHINSVSASNAGRVAYTYNFCGPVFTTGSACSSSLVAIHTACNALILGEAEYALAGSARIMLLPPDKSTLIDNPIASPSQKAKAFDADADGTIGGEGGGMVFLKLLSKALEDGDQIHAIIKASALNSDGRRSNGMNAPSEDGQADIVLKAIKRAKIDPLSISYVESHGTGTKIGDPIEVAGLNNAFRQLGYPANSVPIGSVKTNIGHLDVAAGVTNVIKTVLCLKNKQLPPSLHFNQLNPLIETEDAPVYVNHTRQDWNPPQVRRAGVTSLSLMGTNAHLILEEAPKIQSYQQEDQPKQLITLSARTEQSLDGIVEKLQRYLEKRPELPIADLAYTLNTGRRKFDQQLLTVANSTTELAANLAEGRYTKCERGEGVGLKPIFIFPALEDVSLENLGLDLSQYATYDLDDPGVKYFVTMYEYVRLVEKHSFPITAVTGLGMGKNVVDVIKERISFEEGVRLAKDLPTEPEVVTDERIQKAVAGILKAGIEYLLLFCPSPEFAQRFQKVVQGYDQIRLVSLDASLDHFYTELIAQMAQGLVVNWEKVYQGLERRRISLPGYVFDRKGYYPGVEMVIETGVELTDEEEPVSQVSGDQLDPDQIKSKLTTMLQELHTGELPLDAYFFDLGLTSMSIMFFIGKINKEYGVQLSVTLFFEDITLGQLLQRIVEKILQESKGGNVIARQPKQPYYPASSAQKRQYVLNQMKADSTNYNMTFGFVIEGNVDDLRLEQAVQDLVDRHESLRTYFEFVDGELVQKVVDDYLVQIEHFTGTEDELEAIVQKLVRPFQLDQLPLMRVGLIRYGEEKHLLLLDLHHIISDGSSMEVLIQDFAALYGGTELEELRIQYKDFATWQQNFMASEEFKKQEEYWLETFKGDLPVLDLTTDFPRPAVMDHAGKMLYHKLDQELKTKLEALNNKNETTMYMTLLAVFNVLLSKYSAQEDIIVGSPVSGREHADLERVVGMFVNSIPMRNQPKMDLTFAQFLAKVKENTLKGLECQGYPLDYLVEKLELVRDPGRNPLFDVMFALQSYMGNNISLTDEKGDLTFSSYEFEDLNIKFDLVLEAIPGDDFIQLQLQYPTALFMEETMEQFLRHFQEIVEIVVADDQIQLIDIELASSTEADGQDLRSELDFDFEF